MQKNRMIRLIGLLILAAWMAPGALADGPAQAAPEDGCVTWKIATLAPRGIGWARHAEEVMIAETAKSTDNTVKVEVFWNGVMGDDEDYLAKMRIDQLQDAGFSGQGASLACPEFSVLSLPFLFNNYEEVDYIRDEMFSDFDALFSNYGLKILYWADQDFDQIYSKVSPMETVDDFRKMRFVLWCGPMEGALFNALDADCTPLNVPESVSAMRQGVVDSAIAPAVWMVGAHLYTEVKYVNTTKIRYSPSAIVVTTKAWGQMAPKYKAQYEKERDAVTRNFVSFIRRDNKRGLVAMLRYGIKKTSMPEPEQEKLRKKAMSVYAQLTDIAYPSDLLAEIQGRLESFRKGIHNQ